MLELWRELEQHVASRPLPPTKEERDYWLPPAPEWLSRQDKLSLTRSRWSEMYQEGELVWGLIWIANSVLWKPGTQDSVAGILYSFDPEIQKNPSLLAVIGDGLSRLRNNQHPIPPGFQSLAHRLTDNPQRQMQVPLPGALTDGRTVYFSETMIYRSHLPNRQVVSHPFPVLAQRGTGHICTVVPERYWPEALRQAWVRAEDAPEA